MIFQFFINYNYNELVKRQLLSFRAESNNSVTARFVVSFDYAQDDIFRFETIFYETVKNAQCYFVFGISR